MTERELLLAERVRTYRTAAGLSQQSLAVQAGLSMSLVSQIEQGMNTDPRLSTLTSLARALGVRLSELVGENALPSMTPAGDLEEQERQTDKRPGRPTPKRSGGRKPQGR
jgi:transcriptional regulator with XRE-family HTH domain